MTDPVADQPHMREYGRQHATFLVTPERAFAIIETEEEFSAQATRRRFAGGQK